MKIAKICHRRKNTLSEILLDGTDGLRLKSVLSEASDVCTRECDCRVQITPHDTTVLPSAFHTANEVSSLRFMGDGLERAKGDLAEAGVETGSAVVGALVGLALGGPIGAVVGAAGPPLAVRASRVLADSLQRRRLRAERVLQTAITTSGLSEEVLVRRLESNEDLADHLADLIRLATQTDPQLSAGLSRVIADSLHTSDARDLDRLSSLAAAISGLSPVQLSILRAISVSEGELAASDISAAVAIPEVELRGAVRDLELRGMIKDSGIHPVVWKLRELGRGVMSLVNDTMNGDDDAIS